MGANQNTDKNVNISALLERVKEIEATDRQLLQEKINLPPRDEKFAHAYAATFNLTKAAIATGMVTPKTSRVKINKIAHYYWKKPNVRKRVRQILLPMMLDFDITAYKVVSELAKLATADITDFVGVKQIRHPLTGQLMEKVFIKRTALGLLRKTGDTTVIKEISQRRDGSISIKLHDKSAAQNKLADLMFNTLTNLQKESTEGKMTSFADLLRLPESDPKKKEFERFLMAEDKDSISDIPFVEVKDEDENGDIPDGTKKKLLLTP